MRFGPKVKRVIAQEPLRKEVYDASRNHVQFNSSVNRFYRFTVQPKTIYVKMDDDICYVHPDFFYNACEDLLQKENSVAFVMTNVFNIPMTTKINQDRGVLDTKMGKSDGIPRCPLACLSGPFAKHLHDQFLELYKKNELKKLYFDSLNLSGHQRIGVMLWTGERFAGFGGNVGQSDEKFITQELPVKFGLPVRLIGNALVSHFAFSHQRAELEDKSDILEQYLKIAVDETGFVL
jgi:hypothetical protein